VFYDFSKHIWKHRKAAKYRKNAKNSFALLRILALLRCKHFSKKKPLTYMAYSYKILKIL
jgi:hypothetical protein